MPPLRKQAYFVERFSAAERRVRAFELAKTGASFRTIGQQLGISHAQAQRDVVRVLDEVNALAREHAVDYRTLMLARLDTLLASLWQAATQGDIAASAQALRILERQSKLLGLDAPTKIDLEQRVRVIAEELGLDADAAVSEAARILQAARP